MLGAFFWDYSGYSYSGLGITGYTEFQFPKERSLSKRNTHDGGDLRTTTSAHALVCPETKMAEHDGRVGFPAKKFPRRARILPIPSKLYSVHCGMIFHSFRKRNSSQKNTNTVHFD